MDFKLVGALISAILFLLMASNPAFNLVREAGVKDKEMSLVVRSALVGVLAYLSFSVLL
jgi:hypothetical protein